MLKKKKIIVLIASSVTLLSLTYGCAQPAQSKVSGNNNVNNSAKKVSLSSVAGNIANTGDTDIETDDDDNGQNIESKDNANDKDIETNDDVNGADNEVNDSNDSETDDDKAPVKK